MQNQKAELSDVLSILRKDSIVEIEETLKVSEQNRKEIEANQQQAQQQAQKEQQEMITQLRREEMQHEKELAILKEEEKRETEIVKAALVGMSYNPEADTDGDGVNDFLEIAKHGLDAEVKKTKNQIEREKLEHNKMVDKEKIKLEKQKLSVQKSQKSH